MIREDRAVVRGLETSGIRSITHKDARVMFFDPNVMLKQVGATPLSSAGQTIKDLLYHYMRFPI